MTMEKRPGPTFGLFTLMATGLVVLFLSAALSAQTSGVNAQDAWARVPVPSKMETAVYMMLENHGSQSRSVVSVSSDAADKVEMHQTKTMKSGAQSSGDGKPMGGGMSKSMDKTTSESSNQTMMAMTPVSKIEIPANGKTMLEPNGFHLMMFGLKTRPAAGDKLNLTLKLDDGTSVPVVATVRK